MFIEYTFDAIIYLGDSFGTIFKRVIFQKKNDL